MPKNQITGEELTPANPAPEPESRELEKSDPKLGAEQVQKAFDEAESKGYIGEKVDPRPNSFYSQEGGPPGVE